jgi:hypothetical protein
VQLVTSQIYVNPDKDFARSIMVAGTARSGTTWLGDLIATQLPCRTMFEPFNPVLVPEYQKFNYFQYFRPGDTDEECHAYATKIFSGNIRNRWIDRYNEKVFPKYRLIKEIRANLLLKWLHDHFPQVPILFLMRHPCAVVSSRLELGWATDRDIDHFLNQPKLVKDFLGDKLDLILNAETDEEKHAIIWSVTNLVPLKQFQNGEINMVYYEDLCLQPDRTLALAFASINHPYHSPGHEKISQPSQTAQATSAVVRGTNRVTGWKKKLSPAQIDRILQVVEAFGLENLYGDSFIPKNSAIGSEESYRIYPSLNTAAS